MQKRSIFRGDTIPGLVTMLLGFGVAIYTLAEDTMRFRAQTSDGVPGAGFFPVILGLILGALGLFLMLRGIRAHGKVEFFKIEDEEIRGNVRMLIKTVLCILAFFVLWRLTRQFIACALLLVFGLNFIFGRTLKYNIIYTVVFVAFIYGAFVLGFSIQFNM